MTLLVRRPARSLRGAGLCMVAAAAAVSFAVGGCGSGNNGSAGTGGARSSAGGNSNTGSDSSAASPAVEVATTDAFAFSPAHVTIPSGATVRWSNPSPVPHTVTSGRSSRPEDSPGALFDAPLGSGASFQFTFTTAGDYPYFCRYHEGMGMAGVVTVTP